MVFPDVIIRRDRLAAELKRVEDDMELPNVPLSARDDGHCFTLADIYSAQMDDLSRDVYARDYVMYGFENWE
ncbi:MAG: hypothetical protein QNK92_07670 [Amylibacter sp.]